MEQGQRLVLLDQIKSWCGDSRTKVTIKPVIDLTTELSTPAYEIPDRIREQIVLRDRTCVFPWCTRPARRCDVDHIDEYDHDAEAEGRPQPGPTTTSNLAALCRYHHRLKTFTAWHYRMVAPGVFDVDQPPRPPLPTRPHRHHPDRRTRTTRPTLTPPHTSPLHGWRGSRLALMCTGGSSVHAWTPRSRPRDRVSELAPTGPDSYTQSEHSRAHPDEGAVPGTRQDGHLRSASWRGWF